MTTDNGFHWRHGWFFKRQEDGSVQISKANEKIPDVALPLAIIPAAEWASIVASVSHEGETAAAYATAHRLHDGTPAAIG